MRNGKRVVVTLCGSTRFYPAFQAANYRETMAGRIVLSVGFYRPSEQSVAELAHQRVQGTHGETWGCTPDEKARLDQLHFDKIEMSDEILVLNVEGYVGESTRNEIALAVLLHKPIRWLDEQAGGDEWLEREAHDIGARVAAHVRAGR